MEDYTYDLTPGAEYSLGAHMLEVCPCCAADEFDVHHSAPVLHLPGGDVVAEDGVVGAPSGDPALHPGGRDRPGAGACGHQALGVGV